MAWEAVWGAVAAAPGAGNLNRGVWVGPVAVTAGDTAIQEVGKWQVMSHILLIYGYNVI